jgi:NAD(P)-dependent dehydrogenase (short-subunit alcohol dehydrogenase family)
MTIFRRVFEVNVFGVAQALRDGLAHMDCGGSVIVTSSPAATELLPEISAYAASKAAVNVIVKTAALELGRRGIRVNAVLPGVVETEMALDPDALEQELDMLSTFTVNGKTRQPSDMAGPFQFLASSAGATCTGALLACDDGAMCGFSPLLLERAFG